MKKTRIIIITLFSFFYILSNAQNVAKNFQNPILSGFNPDPSVCRVGDDYYLVTSSFVWYPGIPIYHSKDLVNWELIGHGINRPVQLNYDGLLDKNGVWAVTIRYHKGIYYLITTASDCGGNFYITANNPAGPWSNPVWLKDAPGIDPSLMWDDDDKCYYSGNNWGKGKVWIWAQELDLQQQKLVGERKTINYGHANNARYTEASHLYKIKKDYLLITAEGGSDVNHAVTAHHSSSVLDEYKSDPINPVLTHRQLGKDYPLQAMGHADLVQTQNGDWWSVVLGRRLVDGEAPLARETFLCKVVFENGTPIFNPGYGKVLTEQERPNLPWTLVMPDPVRDNFDSVHLGLKWCTMRTPKDIFYSLSKGQLTLPLRPQVADSLVHSSILVQRILHFQYSATTKLTFKTDKDNEQAGLIVYRTNKSYYFLAKEKSRLVLVKKYDDKKEIVAEAPYNKSDVYLNIKTDKLSAQFSFGETLDDLVKIGDIQNLSIICENKINKFNGPGIGMYVTSNGKKSDNKAFFDWFEYNFRQVIGVSNSNKTMPGLKY